MFDRYRSWCTVNKIAERMMFDDNVLAHYLAATSELTPSPSLGIARAAVHFFAARSGAAGFSKELLSRTVKGSARLAANKPKRIRVWMRKDWVTKALTTAVSLVQRRRAVLCAVGMLGLLRGKEIVSLQFDDLVTTEKGLAVKLRRSKTDQLGRGWACNLSETARRMKVPYWIPTIQSYLKDARAALPGTDPVFAFRDDKGVRRGMTVNLVASAAKKLLEMAEVLLPRHEYIAAHSMRCGGATELLLEGNSVEYVTMVGRWSSWGSMQRYIREVMPGRAGVSVEAGVV